jgi:hypothetical protein
MIARAVTEQRRLKFNRGRKQLKELKFFELSHSSQGVTLPLAGISAVVAVTRSFLFNMILRGSEYCQVMQWRGSYEMRMWFVAGNAAIGSNCSEDSRFAGEQIREVSKRLTRAVFRRCIVRERFSRYPDFRERTTVSISWLSFVIVT